MRHYLGDFQTGMKNPGVSRQNSSICTGTEQKNEGGRAFKCTSFYLKQSCQAMQVVMQYYISRCNKAKKKGTKNKLLNLDYTSELSRLDDFHG